MSGPRKISLNCSLRAPPLQTSGVHTPNTPEILNTIVSITAGLESAAAANSRNLPPTSSHSLNNYHEPVSPPSASNIPAVTLNPPPPPSFPCLRPPPSLSQAPSTLPPSNSTSLETPPPHVLSMPHPPPVFPLAPPPLASPMGGVLPPPPPFHPFQPPHHHPLHPSPLARPHPTPLLPSPGFSDTSSSCGSYLESPAQEYQPIVPECTPPYTAQYMMQSTEDPRSSYHDRSSPRSCYNDRASPRGSYHDRSSPRGSYHDRGSLCHDSKDSLEIKPDLTESGDIYPGGDDSREAYPGGDNTSQTVQQYHSLFIKEGLKHKLCQKLEPGTETIKSLLTNRPKKEREELTREDEERRRRRRERNKVAATKCRNKKKERTVLLVSEGETLEVQNKNLRQEMSRLEAEKRHLNDILRLHESDCKRARTNSYSTQHNQGNGDSNNFRIPSLPPTCSRDTNSSTGLHNRFVRQESLIQTLEILQNLENDDIDKYAMPAEDDIDKQQDEDDNEKELVIKEEVDIKPELTELRTDYSHQTSSTDVRRSSTDDRRSSMESRSSADPASLCSSPSSRLASSNYRTSGGALPSCSHPSTSSSSLTSMRSELRTSSYPYNSTTEGSTHTGGSKGHYSAGNNVRGLTPVSTATGASARQVATSLQGYTPSFLNMDSQCLAAL